MTVECEMCEAEYDDHPLAMAQNVCEWCGWDLDDTESEEEE